MHPRWLVLPCLVASLGGCAHHKAIGIGVASVGALSVIGSASEFASCGGSGTCRAPDVGLGLGLGLGGLALAGVGYAIATAPNPPSEPEPVERTNAARTPTPTPDPNTPHVEEDIRYGAEKAVPGE